MVQWRRQGKEKRLLGIKSRIVWDKAVLLQALFQVSLEVKETSVYCVIE